MISSTELIERDRSALITQISKIAAKGQRYALLDFPDHPNVGDSAIWLGTLRLLKEHMGRNPSYVCSLNYDSKEMANAIGSGPIFLHGGGNMGDIYPAHQDLRNRVIRDNPGRRIIQMPQTIHFRDVRNADATKAALNGHPDHWMLVRDRQSLTFCTEVLNVPAILAPDAAFGLGPLRHSPPRTPKVVALMRADIEKVSRDLSLVTSIGAAPVDWPSDGDSFDSDTRRRAIIEIVKNAQLSAQARRLMRYKARAESRLARGLQILSAGSVVITDRLHAHIFSILLDIPNICLDNDYGKIHAYIDTFSGDWARVHKVTSFESAVAKAREFITPGRS